MVGPHDGEEEHVFPWIEQSAGVPGLMEVNVEQHSGSLTVPYLSAHIN
jgi:hypothetical protein